MSPRSANDKRGAEENRQAMDAEVSAAEATQSQGPVGLPPRSRRWYEESTTYQYILEEGEKIGHAEGRAERRAEELRKMLLRQGQKRFGAPSAAVRQVLESLSDLDRMERMADRVLEVANWQELLDTP
jgi:hypothetical protein